MTPIRVLLADDHRVVREGFHALLSLEIDIVVVGQARDGREAVAMALRLKPAVIVMDIAMPLLNGIGATEQVLQALPDTKVIMLSAYADDPYIRRVVASGAAGYLIKQTSAESLSRGIREVAAGGTFFSPSVSGRFISAKEANPLRGVGGRTLTPRELEVLQRVAEGAPNKAVAAELGISIKTVEKHRQHVMAKLDIHDTAGLTRYAIAHGIIENCVQVTIV